MNKLYLIIVVSIGSNLMYPPAKTNPVGLSENIKGKVDSVLAECGNIVMDFSKIRRIAGKSLPNLLEPFSMPPNAPKCHVRQNSKICKTK